MAKTSRRSRRNVRDGSTPARAILEDQWVWLNRKYPGWTLLLQMLMHGPNDSRIDRLIVGLPSGETRVLHFDVTALHKCTMEYLRTGKWPKDWPQSPRKRGP
jgi:hypothetical protein